MLVNKLGLPPVGKHLEPPEPGKNVVLTIDLDIQRAAEASLVPHQGADARAAVVVMDVNNGDVLAMASSPTINPLYFAGGLSAEEMQRERRGERIRNCGRKSTARRRRIMRRAPFSKPSSRWPPWKTD